uniref:Uncharacterized protein n=1 Tax=viral metagenome TaxID=1070528 RepID=A0A6C0E7X8_9ZZZZ
MSINTKCVICGIYRSNHNMPHPFQEHVINKCVSPDEFRCNIIPQNGPGFQLVNSNPCQLCGLPPQHHTCNHAYKPIFQRISLPSITHLKYSPQKEYQGIVSESYYKDYEHLIETKNKTLPKTQFQMQYNNN